MNEVLTIDQLARGDAILGYDEARTEIGMNNKKMLSPVGPHQNIICAQESRTHKNQTEWSSTRA